MRSVYISGPITGSKNYHSKFHCAEKTLNHMGYWDNVVNPVKIGDSIRFPEMISEHDKYVVYMRTSLKELLNCTHIFMLDGWSRSVGALIEIIVARICGIHVLLQTESIEPNWMSLLKFLGRAISRKGLK